MGASADAGGLNPRQRRRLALECEARAREAIEASDWERAFAHQREALEFTWALIAEEGEAADGLAEGQARLINRLLDGLQRALASEEAQPWPPERRAQLLWSTAALLDDRHRLPVAAPEWLPVVEEALLRKAALCWKERIGDDPLAGSRALVLFRRLAAIVDPCPIWVERGLRELETAATAQAGRERVIRLAYAPGLPRLLEEPGQTTAVNVACCLEATALSEALNELASQANGAALRLEDGQQALLDGWGVRILLGEPCAGAEVRACARAAGHWRRIGTAAGLAMEPAAERPATALAEHTPLIELDPVELAVLGLDADGAGGVEEALGELQRQAGNPGFWRAGEGDRHWWQQEGAALEVLRRFARDRGFYAAEGAPLASLNAWMEAAWCALVPVALWGEGEVWSHDEASPWLVLPVFSALSRESGAAPLLRGAPALDTLHGRLAGEEVLYLGPVAGVVAEQHASGRALGLYDHLEQGPYELRVATLPESRHPLRPHGCFEESLERCLAEIEALQRERPSTLALLGPGVYRLPLCNELRRRYGMACLALGGSLPQLFGVDVPGVPSLCLSGRRQDNWCRADQV